jgi:hypothetical protein
MGHWWGDRTAAWRRVRFAFALMDGSKTRRYGGGWFSMGYTSALMYSALMYSKTLISIAVLIFGCTSPALHGQHVTDRYNLTLHFAIQEHDKRISDIPQREYFLNLSPERFGTYQYGFTMERPWLNHRIFKCYYGAGLSAETATFIRPYNRNYFTGDGHYDLNYTDRYHAVLFQTPIKGEMILFRRIGVFATLLPQFRFLTVAHNYVSDHSDAKIGLGFYSAEINTGLSCRVTRKTGFSIAYRTLQYKHVDKAIFSQALRYYDYPRYETLNLLKFWVSVNYLLEGNRHASEMPVE